ncbi:hypothetical protein [Jeotgalibacillus marinus]|uniref:Uncharacterized protein n=1 Tax=Jeotgalibacillus marinus TaxID=86667 RepID=A0ABV3Q674_9BACL
MIKMIHFLLKLNAMLRVEDSLINIGDIISLMNMKLMKDWLSP